MSDPNEPVQPPSYPSSAPPPPPPPPPYGSAPSPPAPYYGAPTYGGPAAYQPNATAVNPYAHWGLRLAGYLLDSIIAFPFFFVGGVGRGLADYPSATTTSQNIGVILIVVGYGAGILFSIWNQVIRQGRTGQSLGKKWVGIRLVHESSGLPLGGWLTFGRALLHILDALPCYLGFLWPLWDAKRQTFADKIVRSVVLRQQTVVTGPPVPPAW